MKIDSPVLLDTNILVYATNKASPYFKQAKKIRDSAANGKITAFITHQVLLEFYAIITDKRRIPRPLSIQDAAQEMSVYSSLHTIGILLPSPSTYSKALDLCTRYNLSAQEIYDAYLIATALDSQITYIISGDTGMKRFREITVINPFE